jgi:glutamyl-tRNA synthetase
MKDLADAMDIKVKDFLAPLFIAIAGTTASISVIDSMQILGADMSRARIRHALNVLGDVGKKKLKKMEKAYANLT